VGRAALFIDRDGTLIADAHYPSVPEQVVLLAGAAAAVTRANAAQVPVVVITNQSGIGRGLITEAQYESVRARMDALLADAGAHVDATYHCPHFPERDGPCACRKPGIGMHQDAARVLDLSLTASVYIGDRWRDVQPAITTGGLGILVAGEETPMDDLRRAKEFSRPTVRLAETIGEAIDVGLAWISRTHR
jgi:histidinol-phosphate phosphatase family protein